MAEITVLDQNTINKIAAGEVIERPASVVKELLENAIDAGSTAVTVEIRDGGISFIRVTDNGCGIPTEEIPVAFLRHSTSKIRTIDDLFTVSSLGFRGEALSSIASVAQVELITKVSGSVTGSRYRIEGGKEIGLEEVGAPEGTTFIVRNLFFNTPVRKKFLKTPQTEGGHVADLVEKIALSHPEVSIRFIQNNQNRLHTSGNHNLKDIIYTVFGREMTAALLPLDTGEEGARITGFIGKPVIARSNRNYENYYINGRYIKSSVIAKAIEDAYKPFMMQHKYPFVLLHLTISPQVLDVNVHPTKMEVRFSDPEKLYTLIYRGISEVLGKKELIPQITLEEPQIPEAQDGQGQFSKADGVRGQIFKEKEVQGQFSENRDKAGRRLEPEMEMAPNSIGSRGQTSKPKAAPMPEPFEKIRKEEMELGERKRASLIKEEGVPWNVPVLPQNQGNPIGRDGHGNRTSYEGTGKPETGKPKQMDLFEEKLLAPEARKRHKLIGQVFDTYWLVEFNDSLYIIDQHAAHEKVLFEKTMASLKNRSQTSQQIDPPVILTLSVNEEVLLKQYLPCFTDMGFEIEPFGGREYAVRAVPDNLFSIAKKDLLMEMIDDLSGEVPDHEPDLIYQRAATMSCKAAVKGNHQMSVREADTLIDQLLKLENPYACPHGRPTIISMSRYELEKKFKRIL